MEEVDVAVSEGVMHIRLNRMHKLNAITSAMYTEMAKRLQEAKSDPLVHCVLLSGSDETFTAGNDLADFLNAPPGAEGGGVMNFLDVLARFDKPLGAAVAGVAVGIGVTALFHCDFVVAAANATFTAPFLALGLVPEAGSTYLAPRQLGSKAANRLFLLGETFDARQALDAGLISHIAEGPPLLEGLSFARKIARSPVRALLETKRLLIRSQLAPLSAQMEQEARIFASLVQSDESRGRFSAFFADRQVSAA